MFKSKPMLATLPKLSHRLPKLVLQSEPQSLGLVLSVKTITFVFELTYLWRCEVGTTAGEVVVFIFGDLSAVEYG